MNREKIIIALILIGGIICLSYFLATSDIQFKSESNSTWGSKPPATLQDIYIANSTGEHYEVDNTTYYFAYGYVGNKAQKAASNVTITARFYDENGTLIGTNKTTPYKPKNVPPEGTSYFYIGFKDPDRKIASFKLELSMK